MVGINDVLTSGGDLEAANDEAAICLREVEIMARREAGLDGGLQAFGIKP
jgi:hypothetical protein